MAKEKTTFLLDEDVLRRTEAAAAGSGRDESEVVEDALRRYLGLEVIDQVWARNAENALDPDETLALARAELQNSALRAAHLPRKCAESSSTHASSSPRSSHGAPRRPRLCAPFARIG